MTRDELRRSVEDLTGRANASREETAAVVAALLDALESGVVRAAEPRERTWVVHSWVKQGILLGFRLAGNAESHLPPVFHFRDRDLFTTQDLGGSASRVRVVPGGTTIRRGAYLGPDVVVMPPAYVNVGAWVGEGSMVDSHALVGSCAQLGARVHLSAAAQIGGVLEPVGATPVIVEDDVFVGGGCGVYEGARVGRRAVLAAGVILTRSVPLYDLVRGEVLRPACGRPLVVPEGAVVVPGSRPAGGSFAREHGVQVQAPVIVKYRDESTDAASVLEELLR